MTYSRFATFEIHPDKIDELRAFHSGHIMTRLRLIPGYPGLQLHINPKTGKGYSVTLWESRDAARAAFPSLRDLREQGAGELDAMGFVSDFSEGFELLLAEDA